MEKEKSTVSHESDVTPIDETGLKGLRTNFVFDEKEHARILRKLDWHLLPFVSLLYLLSFLDRANIGNAKIAGMAVDAHLDGLKYNIIAAVFFIPYSLAEVPSNVALKLFRPSVWIPSIMVAWGLVMTLMCLCKTFESLIAARVFLGLAESGLFPSIFITDFKDLSLWYRKQEVASRIAIFFSAATVAGAFGGILAYAIEKMEGIGGLHGWQWIFCLEGLLTVIVAAIAFFMMYDYPETASFLTDAERDHLLFILHQDTQGQSKVVKSKFIFRTLGAWRSYLQVGIYIGLLIPVYAIALFLPSIVNQLGYSAAKAQLLTIPPFVAGCLMTILIGFLSDKFKLRGPFIVGMASISLIGYIVLYTQPKHAGASYAGAFLCAVGVYPTIAVDLAWAGSAAGGDMDRGVLIAMVIGMGNLGGICSSFVYLTGRYYIGHGVMMGWLGFSILLSCFTMFEYNRLNRKKQALCAKEGIDESQMENFKDMGNESPLFR
ncbi:major facilitator superfamily domain-containing protein [Flagelloscypha sp. PMI_526]|nr:major facilitator superfamily domain-containing protein [Flagelloscypha sp. PMI_526]